MCDGGLSQCTEDAPQRNNLLLLTVPFLIQSEAGPRDAAHPHLLTGAGYSLSANSFCLMWQHHCPASHPRFPHRVQALETEMIRVVNPIGLRQSRAMVCLSLALGNPRPYTGCAFSWREEAAPLADCRNLSQEQPRWSLSYSPPVAIHLRLRFQSVSLVPGGKGLPRYGGGNRKHHSCQRKSHH